MEYKVAEINTHQEATSREPKRESAQQVVDVSVSRQKFSQEVKSFRAIEQLQRQRGIVLLKAEFPRVLLLFAATQIHPSPVVFGADIDFTNYDLDPPSVTFVNPFTEKPYLAGEMLTHFPRKIKGAQPPQDRQNLLQFFDLKDIPFLCLPGIREYHQNAAHTGDSWFLHRKSGEGTLGFIVDQLYTYGISSLSDYAYAVQMQIRTTGINLSHLPE